MFLFSSHMPSFINLIVQVILLSIPPSVSLVGDISMAKLLESRLVLREY